MQGDPQWKTSSFVQYQFPLRKLTDFRDLRLVT